MLRPCQPRRRSCARNSGKLQFEQQSQRRMIWRRTRNLLRCMRSRLSAATTAARVSRRLFRFHAREYGRQFRLRRPSVSRTSIGCIPTLFGFFPSLRRASGVRQSVTGSAWRKKVNGVICPAPGILSNARRISGKPFNRPPLGSGTCQTGTAQTPVHSVADYVSHPNLPAEHPRRHRPSASEIVFAPHRYYLHSRPQPILGRRGPLSGAGAPRTEHWRF